MEVPLFALAEQPVFQTPEAIDLLIVDEQPLTLMGLSAMFQAEAGVTCRLAATAPQAISLFTEKPPDVVITDIYLPDMNGLAFIQYLISQKPELGVVVVTDRADALCAERSLRVGARAYVLKNDPCESIVAAVRRVRSGGFYLNPQIGDTFCRALIGRPEMLIPSPIDVLSEREFEIFGKVGMGFSSRQIAEQMGLSVKTVETYRNRIKTKLNLHHTGDVIQQAIQWVESKCECYNWKPGDANCCVSK